jgi:Polyketide cyclase / dehydrase and lipid transport
MGLYVCPADIVAAPAETVWSLLSDPASYGDWADAHIDDVAPPGMVRRGQVVRMTARALGIPLRVRFDIDRVDPVAHELAFRATFPLGIRMQEQITVRAVGEGSRVQYG